MAWIESHQAIGAHPKTIVLAELLNIKLPTAVGHLHYLWWWALDYAQDGRIGRFQPKVIAHACHWSGRPQEFLDGLIGAGFVDLISESEAVIHDWQEYAGGLLDRRLRDAERKRTARRQAADVQAARNGTSAGHATDVHTPSGVPDTTNRTQPDSTNRSTSRATVKNGHQQEIAELPE